MASYADLPNKDSFTETINEIIELKSSRKYLYETNISKNEAKEESIGILRERIANFRDVARNLQSSITSENNRIFVTDDKNYIVGQVKPNAPRGDYEIEVLELAKKQLIVSGLISPEITLPASLIEIKLAKENITLEFAGGSPQNLARSITEASKGAYTASLVRRSAEEAYFVIQANQAGLKNRFNLQLDTGKIFNLLKVFKPVPPIIKTLMPIKELVNAGLELNEKSAIVRASQQEKKTNQIKNDVVVTLPLNKTVDYLKTKNVFFKVNVITPPVITNNNDGLTMSVSNINETDKISKTNKVLKNIVQQKETEIQRQTNIISAEKLVDQLRNGKDPLLEITYKIEEQEKKKLFTWRDVSNGRLWINDINLRAKFNKTVQLISAKFIKNSLNVDYKVSAWWESLYNTNQDKFIPINEQEAPTQTKFKFFSIEMEQDGREVVDLVEGVTLNLLKVKEGPIRFSIAGNDDTYTGQIIDFVNQYNFAMDLINLYLAPKKEDLGAEDIDPDYEDRIGVLSSEINIRRMKERMQAIMQNAYVIEPNERKVYLQEIGLKIFNSFAKPYHINNSKVEIDEDTLKSKVVQYGDKIKYLFRYDQNRDFIPDGGFAYLMDRMLTQYLGPNSFFTLMEKSLERERKLLDKSLDSENEKISSYREKLEFDFARVKQLQERQKQMSSWLNTIQKK